ncbi:nucleotide-diphospho-sugar transferase [Baffinella frigidus]|nr:nucleotide-diphospho-sugar transferase [Cryptophyta sp. CCMP2293]
MTGSIIVGGLRSAFGAARFAASRAELDLMAPSFEAGVFFLLGMSASLAFEWGALFRPMAERFHLTDSEIGDTTAWVPSLRRARAKRVSKEVYKSSYVPNVFLRPRVCTVGGGAVAVVIPALIRSDAERETLQACVASIASDQSVKNIIVVDDGSPSPLRLSGCTVVRHALNCGPAAARNSGMRLALEAGAGTIVFTDADCCPLPGWASAHATLQKTAPGVWAGHTVAAGTGLVSRYHNAIGTLMPRVFLGRGDAALYGPTCNLSISRSVASSVAFDASFPTSAFEDCDFCVRAHAAGFTVRASAHPLVAHHFDERVRGLLSTYHKYGRSQPLMMRKHPGYADKMDVSEPATAQ